MWVFQGWKYGIKRLLEAKDQILPMTESYQEAFVGIVEHSPFTNIWACRGFTSLWGFQEGRECVAHYQVVGILGSSNISYFFNDIYTKQGKKDKNKIKIMPPVESVIC